MAGDVLIHAEHVGKKFCRNLKRSLWYGVQDAAADLFLGGGDTATLRRDEFWALEDVSFEVRRGQCLGLVGRNGAGKTTLLKMLNGLIKPDRGRIDIRGRVGALIALGAGFNPILSGRENVYVNGAVLGLGKKEIDARFDEIVDFAELEQFIDAPVASYSSGMQVRLGFAVATALQPDVILLDEVLAVGDAAFRAKCFERIGKILADAAVIFVSHSEAQIQRICNEALLLRNGRVEAQGAPGEVLGAYRLSQGHGLAASRTVVDPRISDLSLKLADGRVPWGGGARLRVAFTTDAPLGIGMVFLHAWRNGDFVCNGEIICPDDRAIRLAPGRHEFDIDLAPLHLGQGRYPLTLALFDETGKRTLVHSLHFAEIEMQAPLGMGPTHLIPLSLKRAEASIARAANGQ